MNVKATFSASLLALLIAAPVTAQARWTLDVRAGAALPTQDIGEDELGTGFGFEGALGYRFLEHLTAYAGWDWHRFAPDQSFAGSETDFEETGYAYGLRFEHPFAGELGSAPAYRLRIGGTYNHIELEDGDGDIIADSGHGAGWEVGAGVSLGLTGALRLSPEVRYRALSRDVQLGNITTDVDLQYIALDVGVTWSF
jgi:hypothetical protein